MTERRYDPVTGEWRMFAGDRQDRTFLPPDDLCPLCPTRPGGPATEIPLPAFDVVVFENRFPALTRHPPEPAVAGTELYPVTASAGANEVVVYSDDHRRGLGELDVAHVGRIIDVWAERYVELGRRPEVGYVFIFENRGEAVGATITHPHGQIYAYPDIPPRARQELDAAAAHLARTGRCVYCDVLAREASDGARVVAATPGFLAYVPFAARFPYELHVAPRRHTPTLTELAADERLALAELLRAVARGYDRLFGFPLPYVMSMHQAPTDGGDHAAVSHLHLELTPLHRAADRLKFLAGSELGAGAFINDGAPEETAARLRAAVAAPSA